MQSQEKDLEARGAPLELAQASRADVSTGPCRIHEWTEGPARNKRREAGGVVCTGPGSVERSSAVRVLEAERTSATAFRHEAPSGD